MNTTAHWNYMVNVLNNNMKEPADSNISDQMLTDVRCLYVETTLLEPTSIVLSRTQHKAIPVDLS